MKLSKPIFTKSGGELYIDEEAFNRFQEKLKAAGGVITGEMIDGDLCLIPKKTSQNVPPQTRIESTPHITVIDDFKQHTPEFVDKMITHIKGKKQ